MQTKTTEINERQQKRQGVRFQCDWDTNTQLKGSGWGPVAGPVIRTDTDSATGRRLKTRRKSRASVLNQFYKIEHPNVAVLYLINFRN